MMYLYSKGLKCAKLYKLRVHTFVQWNFFLGISENYFYILHNLAKKILSIRFF